MKALTIWQPWASLVMIGAKPCEFRRWDYRTRDATLEGQRIVIHAGARHIRPREVLDIKAAILEGRSSLKDDVALPLIERLLQAHKCQGVLFMSAGLGTAILGTPRRIDAWFKAPGSDRIHRQMWAWPLLKVEPFSVPVPCRGAQVFW